MAQTPFQPTLPAEVPFTDAELNFIEESPPGLYPENQNSNAGLVRKLFTDDVQELITQQITLYNERFVDTSNLFLDEWERMVGLPMNPPGRSVAQRKLDVLARLARGPFTRTRRRLLIEDYIAATFGDPIILTPDGVLIDSAGNPLFSGIGSLAGTYVINENVPIDRNLVPNGSFETNVTGWNAQNGTIGRYSGAKFGVWDADFTCTTNANSWMQTSAFIPVVAGHTYSMSAWVKRIVGGRAAQLYVAWYTGAGAFISDVQNLATVPTLSVWTKYELPNVTAPPTAAQAYVYVLFSGGTQAASDEFLVDGIQFEDVTVSKNLIVNGDFESGVQWWAPSAGGTNGFTISKYDPQGSALPRQFGLYVCDGVCASTGATWMGPSSDISVYPGQDYTLSAYVLKHVGARGVQFQIYWYDASVSVISTSISPLTVLPGNTWQRLTFTASAPANAAYALPLLVFQGGTMVANDEFFVDGVQFEIGTVATNFYRQTNSFVDTQKTPYYYEVRIRSDVTIDFAGVTRELKRITPAGISFDVNSVATP